MGSVRRLLAVFTIVVAGSAVAPPAGADRALAVEPGVDLVDGQLVTITGTGYTPGATIAWCQAIRTAAPSPSDCGTSAAPVVADADGDFSVTHHMQRLLTPFGSSTTTDCAQSTDACVMGAAEFSDLTGTITTAPLAFGPGLPVAVPGSATVTEGFTGTVGVDVPLSLSAASDETVTVEWTTLFAPGAPGHQADPSSDYVSASGTLSFAPGETVQHATVTINGDLDQEEDEYAVVSFHDPTNAIMGGFWGLGFAGIRTDDPTTVVPGSAVVTEGDTGTQDLAVPVSLSAPYHLTVTVEWTTVFVPTWPGSQAQPGVDYTPASGTVTFAPGETEQTVLVPVHGDVDVEPDEFFGVSFHDPTNARLGGLFGLGFGTVDNDD